MVAAVVVVSTLALAGMASAKVVVGNAGENYLVGTPQKDEISGLTEDDFIVGRGDADDLSGGRGEDKLEGRRGGDYIVGGRGVDDLYGHGGNDRIEAADGEDEFVNCGRGDHDHASVDGGLGDRVYRSRKGSVSNRSTPVTWRLSAWDVWCSLRARNLRLREVRSVRVRHG